MYPYPFLPSSCELRFAPSGALKTLALCRKLSREPRPRHNFEKAEDTAEYRGPASADLAAEASRHRGRRGGGGEAEATCNDVEDAEGGTSENLRPLAESPPEAGQLEGRLHFATPSLAQKKY